MAEKHLTEEQIRLFLLSPDELTSGELEGLKAHVSMCALCSEHLQSSRAMFSDLTKELDEPPSQRDNDLAKQLLGRRRGLRLPSRSLDKRDAGSLVESYAEFVNLSRSSAAGRLVDYTRAHPTRVISISTIVAGLLFVSFMLVRPSVDKNPAYVEVEGVTLAAFDKRGERLWDRSARGIPQGSSLSKIANGGRKMQLLVLDDFDGDGRNEIVLSGMYDVPSAERDFASDSLYCLSYDGVIKWRVGSGTRKTLRAVGADSSARWHVHGIFTCRINSASNPKLFAVANYSPFWPTKLFEIDAATGEEKQVYWHSGDFDPVISFDIDGDGSNEIVLGGINNAYGMACIAVFRPANIDGVGPTSPGFAFDSGRPGTEKFYLLLPPTDVHFAYDRASYNVLKGFRVVGASGLVAYCQESFDSTGSYSVVYMFSSGMAPKSVTGADNFLKLRRELIDKGKLREKPDGQYYDGLMRSIRYWDGEKFVKQPTSNRHYSTSVNRE